MYTCVVAKPESNLLYHRSLREDFPPALQSLNIKRVPVGAGFHSGTPRVNAGLTAAGTNGTDQAMFRKTTTLGLRAALREPVDIHLYVEFLTAKK